MGPYNHQYQQSTSLSNSLNTTITRTN